MALPVSTDWTLFDFNDTGIPEHINQILTYGAEVTTSRLGVFVYVDFGGDEDLHLMSDDGAESSVVISSAVGELFSFECDFYATSLPPDLNSLNTNRCFLSVYDKQNDTAGLLLSQSGVAWAASVAGVTSLTPVPGSAGLVVAGTWYTIRLVIDGDNNVYYVYITPRATLATTGHILRYTTSSLTTPAGAVDSCRLEAFGTAVDPTDFQFEVLRLSHTLNIPNKPPIAVVGDDIQVLAGTYAKLDGRASYDPDGEDLTYSWRLKQAPQGSRYRSSGVDGWTPAEGDPDNVTNKFKYDAGFQDLELLQAGDLLQVGSVLATVSSTSFDANGDLLDPVQLVLTSADLTENQSSLGWEIFHQQSVGTPTSALTYADIDIDGLWVFGLTVNDGEIDSMETELVLQGVDTKLSRAMIPDLSYVWKCLGDEWSYIEDRTKIQTIWEAFSLVAAGYIYWAWQVRASSCLGEIPRQSCRKWVHFGTRAGKENWDTPEFNHMHPAILGADISSGAQVAGKTLTLSIEGTQVVITFVGADPVSGDSVVSQINAGSPRQLASLSSGRLKLYTTVYFHVDSGGTANTALGFSAAVDTPNVLEGVSATPKVPAGLLAAVNEAAVDYEAHYSDLAYHAVDDVTNGLTLSHPLGATATPAEVVALWNDVVDSFDPHDANNGGGYHVTASLYQTGLSPAVTLEDIVSQYPKYKWAYNSHLADAAIHVAADTTNILAADTPTAEGSASERKIVKISDIVDLQATDIDLKGFLFHANDGVNDGEVYRIDRVLSAGTLLLRDPLPEITTYSWSIFPTVRLPEFDSQELRLSDYDKFEVSFTPDDTGASSDVVTTPIAGGRGELVAFDPSPWAAYSGLVEIENIVKCQHLPTYLETTSIPYLQEKVEGAQPLRENKDFVVEEYDNQKWIRFFQPSEDPPLRWWAEYILFDNSPVIESNFGRLIGYLTDDVIDGADYLSSVQALFYSYWRGSLVSAVKLGLQVIFGLPMAESAGTVIDIDTFYSTTLGRILIEDSDDATVRSYYFNRLASVAINPVTESQYVVGDTVSKFDLLCTGVDVSDYLSNPHWLDNYVAQGFIREVEKFHTFYVGADVDIFGYQNIDVAQHFLDRIKEKRTRYHLIPYKKVDDEIDITDAVELGVTQYFYDHLRSLSDGGAKMFDDADGSGNWRQRFDDDDPEGDRWAFDTTLHEGYRESVHEVTSCDASGVPVAYPQLLAHDPPTLHSKDLVGFNFAGLDGKTLEIRVSDGRMSPYLTGAAMFNRFGDHNWDYIRDGAATINTSFFVGIDLASPWKGSGSLSLPDTPLQPYIYYQFTGGANALVQQGEISLRVRFDYSGSPSGWPGGTDRSIYAQTASYVPPSIANFLQLRYADSAAFPGTGEFQFLIYDSAGVLAATLTDTFDVVAGTWYEIVGSFNMTSGEQYLFRYPDLIGTGLVDSDNQVCVRDNVTGAALIGEQGAVAGSFDVDNLRLYDRMIHTAAFTPTEWEAYYDPGVVTVTFSTPASLQDVVDQVNAAVHHMDPAWAGLANLRTASIWTEGNRELLMLRSWNNKLEIVGGTAVDSLGFTAGYVHHYLGKEDTGLQVLANWNGTRDKMISKLNILGAAFENHRQDEPGDYHPPPSAYYHAVEDTTNALTTAALDPATCTDADIQNYINDVKAKYNLHDQDSGGAYHGGGWGHQEGTADATDLNTVAILFTALEATFHLHMHDTTGYHAIEDLDNVFEQYGMGYLNLDYVRNLGSRVPVITGTPIIGSTDPKFGIGCVDLSGGANSLLYSGAGIVDDIWHAGTIRMWFRPNYSGSPAGTHKMVSVRHGIADTSNELLIQHTVAGNLEFAIRDVGDVLIATLSAAWNPVLDASGNHQWYFLEATSDSIAGWQRLRVDGVTLVAGANAYVRVGGQQTLEIGDAVTSRGAIDDLQVCGSVISWSDYSPPEVETRKRVGLIKEELYLDNDLTAVQTEDFDDVVPAANVEVIANFNDIGVGKYDLDYVYGAGPSGGTPAGVVDIVDGQLALGDVGVAPAAGSVSYVGAGIVDAVINTGCIGFWFMADSMYVGGVGAPSQIMYSSSVSPAGPADAIEIYHDGITNTNSGRLVVDIYNAAGALIDPLVLGHTIWWTAGAPWAPTPMQPYWIEVNFDGADTDITVDGVPNGAHGAVAIAGRGSSAQLLQFGEDFVATGNANAFYINSLNIYSTLQHAVGVPFTPPTTEMRTGTWTRFDSIYTFSPVNTLQLDTELTGTQTVSKLLK